MLIHIHIPIHIMTEQQQQPEFKIHPASPVGFGKLKGKPHSDLLKPDNTEYAKWIINQTELFRYNTTRVWLMENIKEGNKQKKYYTIIINEAEINKDPGSIHNISQSDVVAFTNQLLTLTRKYKDLVKLQM
jgi:hypothetical protein